MKHTPLEIFIGKRLPEDVKANIQVREKNGMYLYNYSNVRIVERDHPVLVKCRGLVLDKTGKVLNYPLDRFFNPHERESSWIDWDTAVVLEKVDGSLICVFWNGEGWEVTTRGSFYPNKGGGYADFAEKFKELFTNWDRLDRGYCYIFEMCSKMNRIVTWYNTEFVTLIGVRDLTSLAELPLVLLQHAGADLGVRTPKVYDVHDLEACRAMFESFPDDEEGFVVVDADFNRIKMKQDSYLAMAKIKMLSEDDILDYVRGKIALDGELLQKDPDVKAKVDSLRNRWTMFNEFMTSVFDDLVKKETRKEFAMEAAKFKFRGFLFAMLDEKNIREMRLSYDDFCKCEKDIMDIEIMGTCDICGAYVPLGIPMCETCNWRLREG
jgi:hypothetical protein